MVAGASVLVSAVQPIAFVSAMDVAAVVVRAATDSALRGQVLEIGGKRLTMNELAAAGSGGAFPRDTSRRRCCWRSGPSGRSARG